MVYWFDYGMINSLKLLLNKIKKDISRGGKFIGFMIVI